ncbi:hypothetical protein [Vibrio sonorensis]|uniref:hypothetical protein n=1 Tax=Vibrio sonorensis TaxID=1004316 RepID=UPI001FE0C44F|nr:hypothetical protein [Vibrio sonorensis]
MNIKETQALIQRGDPSNQHNIARGDEFQSLVHNFESALNYALLYRVGVKAMGKKFDCRISFAIASGAYLRDSVGESMGQHLLCLEAI